LRERIVLVCAGEVRREIDLSELPDVLTDAGGSELLAQVRETVASVRRESERLRRKAASR